MANSISPSSVATTVTGVAAGMALAHYLRPVLVPFFLAVLLRIGVDAVVQMAAGVFPKAPKWLVRLATAGLMGTAIIVICYVVAQGVSAVAYQIPAIVSRLDSISQGIALAIGAKDADFFSVAISHIDGPALVQWLASGIHEPVEIVLLTLLMAVFMLAAPRAEDNPKLDIVARHAARAARQRTIIAHITNSIQNYMVVQLATNGAIGLAVAAACFTFGLKGAAFWGATSFILAFIPVVGPLIASVLPALSALAQSSMEWQAVAVFVAVQAIFTVAHNLVLPKLQAKSQNIDPIAGLLALGIWTLLWGVWGALLATPLTMLIMITMAQFESSRWFAALLSHDGRPETGGGEGG
ncbi:AI-2E family transporter [Trinickia caryophylli]|uniref:Predicted PurR-regulated permease PerM n=1 Tax=Trinickia caryophylli TaxID=28094 RepID=A0A1X7GP74_TRICW|nr:AI-2E family transporter [Trinickia caryophylli]PMS10503.1 AI-2E family transporter [Trinickia caryophylli]TRX19103.1 AI-2E family transporter [Trinickia caryophylli]WQE10095.1 AI-2E family transporter [Trinickia caryophylli]SMF72694.1 Predicted PurR-regulated permease PerM [Trinickia caryophylli]GLU35114.1 AI-2E family transporter [Trinickia caryophylli]